MTSIKVLVGTPDPGKIRRSRLEWIAQTLSMPLARASQAMRPTLQRRSS